MSSNKIEQPSVAPELTEVIQKLRDVTVEYLTSLGGVVFVHNENEEIDVQAIEDLYPSDDEYEIKPPKPKKTSEPKKDLIATRIGILQNLIRILDSKDPQTLPIEKINQYYNYLKADPDMTLDDPNISLDTNLDVLKMDKSKSTARFLAGVALLALTALTLVAPGLIVMGIVYGVTHRHVFDLFKTKSDFFEKNAELIKPNDLKLFKVVPIEDDAPLPTNIPYSSPGK